MASDDLTSNETASPVPPSAARRDPPTSLEPGRVRSVRLTVTVVLALCLAALVARPLWSLTWETFEGFEITAALTLAVLGAAIVKRVPRSRVGWCFIIAGGCAAASATAAALTPLSDVFAWLHSWLPWCTYALLPYALLHFPDDRLPTEHWRAAVRLTLVGVGLPAAALAVAAAVQPDLLEDLNTSTPPVARAALIACAVGIACSAGAFVASICALVLRWCSAHGEERQQLKWLCAGGTCTLLAVIAQTAAVPLAWTVAAIAIPAASAVAILRYRLYDLDLFVNRTLVYLVTSAVVTGCCAVLLPVATASTVSSHRLLPLIVTTSVLVLLVDPVRRRTQHVVDRFLRGHHDNPHAVITSLTRTISRTQDASQLLSAVVSDVAGSLKLPYVGIQLHRDGQLLGTTEIGRSSAVILERFPMTHQGLQVGVLLVARRSPGEPFSRGEHDVLEDLARQAGAAADAARLTVELHRSREQLRRDLEEERRKLRHDLHDSLGPMLAGLLMQAGAGQSLQRAEDREGPARTFASLERGLQQCVAEVRVLINGLHRPAALDQVGLLGAVEETVRSFAGASLQVALQARPLPELPAAVEVAAFRIVCEAMANVVKHSGAANATVVLKMQEASLWVQVDDDGVGFSTTAREGEGLHSMRERAVELGGSTTVQSRTGGGTSVAARLPVDSGRI